MDQGIHRFKYILYSLILAVGATAIMVGAVPLPPSQPLPPVTQALPLEMDQVTKECEELTAREVGILCKLVVDKDGNPTLSLDFATLETLEEHWKTISTGFAQDFSDLSNRQKKKGLIILTLVKEEMFKAIYCNKNLATPWLHFSVLPFVPYIMGTPEPEKKNI